MPAQKYSVNQHPIQALLTYIGSGEIAIPEIQRPFVWSSTKVRDFLDSLYQGYPVGYLISWRNPAVRLKDGTTSEGKRILIDGQQRVTALMAALLGQRVISKNYNRVKIRIAFHPMDRKFEVLNPAIQKDREWIDDISEVIAPEVKVIRFVNGYCENNPEADLDEIFDSIERLRGIVNNHIGLIELNSDLDIETVTEIFIRINSKGVVLSQADFAMSKIASNESYNGNISESALTISAISPCRRNPTAKSRRSTGNFQLPSISRRCDGSKTRTTICMIHPIQICCEWRSLPSSSGGGWTIW